MGLEILMQDITKLEVDAIVNAANNTLLDGGGINGAIHHAAGPKMTEECRALGGCRTGESKVTMGYNLNARYIIHTVAPIWVDGEQNEPALLESCYKSALHIAKDIGCRSVALPSIITGVYRFPIKLAASIAIPIFKAYLNEENTISRIIVACMDEQSFNVYNDVLFASE